ncbi:MAG TPA: MAPEG family protein [Hyphomicrobiales bacterium]|nr:MAPEG family protein [Hyphomicrobiales bacterium]
MPLELKLLVWSVALTFILVVIAVSGATHEIGLGTLAGNRQDFPEMKGWAGRAQRAHRNMLESLVLFASLILVAQITGKLNAMTALGAQLFFWARVAHAAIYIAGIKWLRTLAWAVSIAGLILIFLQVV